MAWKPVDTWENNAPICLQNPPSPMNPSDPVPDSLLRHRPFVLYWIARVFAAFSFQMVGVAVGWQMYALTGSAFDLGLVGLVQFVPTIVLTLVVGHVADRYDRRRVVVV